VWGRWALVALVFAGSACTSEPEHAVLLRVFSADDEALLQGTAITVDAWLLGTDLRETAPPTDLDRDVSSDDHFRVAVVLPGPAEVRVRVEAEGTGGFYAATRCWPVVGVTKADVMLTGPLGDLADPDGDGWATIDACRPRQDGSGCAGLCPDDLVRDCEPDDPDAHPGAEDACGDEIDQDCDGDAAPCGDGDGDGVPECPVGVEVDCDCNDEDAGVGPTVEEGPTALCENGLDDDCDGVDALCDRDGDGVARCPGDDPALTGCDCDDDDPTVNPGASETPGGECNGRDDNCNGQTDEVEACLGDDLDVDGSEHPDDCNDCNAAMTPGGSETCGDRIDGACALGGGDDGQPLPDGADACDPDDADEDGYIDAALGGTDCDDADPERHPSARDRCGDDVDADCSGSDSSCATDGDDDGWNVENDCDDGDATRAPGLQDECNGIDDDCDGRNDEDIPPGTGCILSGDEWAVVDFATSLLHCGRCRGSCNTGCSGALCRADACEGGECRCGAGEACAGDANDFCCQEAGCRDLDVDTENCGACGVECQAGECLVPTCASGECDVRPAPDGTECSSQRFCCGGACTGECAPDSVEPRACGNCGTQSRTCDDDCTWGDWGACSDTGPCAPGTNETEACGNCGMRQRSCGGDCEWDDWSACAGEGACLVGAVRQQACGDCGNQEQRCDAVCAWQNFGSCDNNPATSTCGDGDPCTINWCDSSGECQSSQTECCGNDVSDCGDEPECADWECNNGNCVLDYENRNSDPEGECPGSRCCNGSGECRYTERSC
jgi:hypothetical protein